MPLPIVTRDFEILGSLSISFPARSVALPIFEPVARVLEEHAISPDASFPLRSARFERDFVLNGSASLECAVPCDRNAEWQSRNGDGIRIRSIRPTVSVAEIQVGPELNPESWRAVAENVRRLSESIDRGLLLSFAAGGDPVSYERLEHATRGQTVSCGAAFTLAALRASFEELRIDPAPHPDRAFMVPVSRELLADSAFPFEEMLRRDFNTHSGLFERACLGVRTADAVREGADGARRPIREYQSEQLLDEESAAAVAEQRRRSARPLADFLQDVEEIVRPAVSADHAFEVERERGRGQEPERGDPVAPPPDFLPPLD